MSQSSIFFSKSQTLPNCLYIVLNRLNQSSMIFLLSKYRRLYSLFKFLKSESLQTVGQSTPVHLVHLILDTNPCFQHSCSFFVFFIPTIIVDHYVIANGFSSESLCAAPHNSCARGRVHSGAPKIYALCCGIRSGPDREAQ